MKRWIFSLTVLLAVVLAALGAPPPSWGDQLISFTDTSLTGEAGYLSDTYIKYASWSQTVPITDAAIGVTVTAFAATVGLSGQAWLTDAIGPGATAADVIATASFTAPIISDEDDLTAAPYTTLFTGLSLNPGTYYLVLQAASPPSGVPYTYAWLGDFTGVGVNTAPDFSVGPFGYNTSTNAAFPYASSFGPLSGYLFYRLESTAVPLPGAVWLLGTGLLGLGAVGWRRRKKG